MWLSKDLSHQISWSTECLTPPWTPSADVEDQQLRQHRVPSPQRQTANAPLVIQFLANALGRCQFVVDILFHSYLSSVFLLTGILSEFSISKEHRTCSKNPVMYPHLAVVWFPSFYLAWMSSGWGRELSLTSCLQLALQPSALPLGRRIPFHAWKTHRFTPRSLAGSPSWPKGSSREIFPDATSKLNHRQNDTHLKEKFFSHPLHSQCSGPPFSTFSTTLLLFYFLTIAIQKGAK